MPIWECRGPWLAGQQHRPKHPAGDGSGKVEQTPDRLVQTARRTAGSGAEAGPSSMPGVGSARHALWETKPRALEQGDV